MARGKGASDKLSKLLDKMDSVAKSGGDFWGPSPGRNVIRVLPPVDEMGDIFFQEVGLHYNLPDGSSEYCPNFTTEGEYDCPICDLVSELYKSGDEKARAWAGKLRYRKKFFMNVVVRDPNDDGGDTGVGPRVYTPGVMVLNSMAALLRDPDYGEFYDISGNGYDLIITKTGEGINTEYQVMPRKACPLHKDKAIANGWVDEAIDLSWVILSNDPDEDEENSEDALVILTPYDRLVEKYGLEPGVDVGLLSEEEDDKEEYQASTKSRKEKSEEDEEGEPEEPEEEDEVGSAIRQRRQRRRRSS